MYVFLEINFFKVTIYLSVYRGLDCKVIIANIPYEQNFGMVKFGLANALSQMRVHKEVLN